MWDLIVLIPDHCLSLYLLLLYVQNLCPNIKSFYVLVRLTQEPEVPGSISGPATNVLLPLKKGCCQLLAKVCARSTG